MKKLNKKGFTLAELLIVIAIIAILIAIAIPAFSASLHRANIATDHANIRNAYAIARTAELTGYVDDGSASGIAVTTGKTYVYCVDGAVKEVGGTGGTSAAEYKLKENAETGDCKDSQGCGFAETTHKKNATITIQEDSGHWVVKLVAPSTP